MDSTSNKSGMPKMSRLDKAKQQYKSAPTLSIPEMVSRNKEFLIDKRKISKSCILDADRDLEVADDEVPDEVPNKEVPSNKVPDNKVPNTKVPNRVMKSKEQIKQRILEWKNKKEQQKKEAANKVKPFLAGAIKVPAYYVPPPPLPKIKQKDNVVNTNVGGDKYHKKVPNIPKTSESNVTKTKKSQCLQSICSKKEKSQTVSKKSQPKSEAGPSCQSKLKEKFSTKKKGSDNKITEKVVPEDDLIVSKFQTQLNTEVDRILKMCSLWDKISKTAAIPSFAQEMVLGVTGQGRLLVSQKMAQFRSLIEMIKKPNCPGTSSVGPVLSQDLHGFWDMMYLQVVDLNKRFGKLEKLKANNWEEDKFKENKKPSKQGRTKPASKPKKKAAISLIRDFILDAKRKKLAQKQEKAARVKIFDAGSLSMEWAKRQADAQLELPSTSGAVPAQCGSAAGPSSSTMRLFEERKAQRDRRWTLETLEEDVFEEERIAQLITSRTKEPKDNLARPHQTHR